MAGVLGDVVADGAVALLVQPADRIVAARISGSVRCFTSGLLPPSHPLRGASHCTSERAVRGAGYSEFWSARIRSSRPGIADSIAVSVS